MADVTGGTSVASGACGRCVGGTRVGDAARAAPHGGGDGAAGAGDDGNTADREWNREGARENKGVGGFKYAIFGGCASGRRK
jgi:hypothetical protein